MKTLKNLIALFIVIGFTSNDGNSQPVREESTAQMGIYVPCLGELISGMVIWQRTQWDNKIQIKVMDGVLYGSKTHNEYHVTEIINHEMWFDQSAVNKTFTRMLIIRLDGKLVARMPILQHYTINANGEKTVDFTTMDVDCK
jgi:hypothetical protein